MPNILVTGSNGQLGSELRELADSPKSKIKNPDFHYHFTNHSSLDITDSAAVEGYCIDNHIDAIVNCAAYTAVDGAETEEELADKTNHQAVKNMAQIAKNHHIKLIHISTDYVFDGKHYKHYAEEDRVNPQSVYGKTKLAGEKAILQIAPQNSIIIRTSWLYSSYGRNFVKTMLRLGKEREELGMICDQTGSPTYAKDLAEVILQMLDKMQSAQYPTKIYHYSNEGFCTWYDFAKEIMNVAKLDCQINPLKTHQYPTPAKRPSYSLLSKAKIKNDFNIEIPHWTDSLSECLVKMDAKK